MNRKKRILTSFLLFLVAFPLIYALDYLDKITPSYGIPQPIPFYYTLGVCILLPSIIACFMFSFVTLFDLWSLFTKKEEWKMKEKETKLRLVMMCEECGEKLPEPELTYIPYSFVIICYGCYVKFKRR